MGRREHPKEPPEVLSSRVGVLADRVLVAVSGGKDSLSLWYILKQLGYQADGVTLQFGIDEGEQYSAQSHRYIEQFIEKFWPGSVLHTIDVKSVYGESIPEVARRTDRGNDRPCAVCGLIKRHEMNRLAYELGYDVLVTGHNLDDEAAVLWSNILNWQIDSLVRQSPILEADRPGLAHKPPDEDLVTGHQAGALDGLLGQVGATLWRIAPTYPVPRGGVFRLPCSASRWLPR